MIFNFPHRTSKWEMHDNNVVQLTLTHTQITILIDRFAIDPYNLDDFNVS